VGDRICTGCRDGRLVFWSGTVLHGSLALVQESVVGLEACATAMLYHAASKWIFCGLSSGQIKAYRREPPADYTLVGHTAAVSTFVIHEAILLSGDQDSCIRLWRHSETSAGFECVATVRSEAGGVTALLVQMPENLWVGGQSGINCLRLQRMESAGTLASAERVVSLLSFESYVLAAYGNGAVKAFNAAGVETFCHGPAVEHSSNTVMTTMRHPGSGKAMLLCGQKRGLVAVYDLPEFRPRGTFSTGYEGDVTAIVDLDQDGLFATCGLSGDVVLWRWEGNGLPDGKAMDCAMGMN